MPYVFDEPTKPARLTILGPGGASASYDMTTLKEGTQLTYENFIYVCLTVTFDGDDMSTGSALDPHNEELVLDVPEGTRVVLSSKETGKRSQLWRMTGSGMLQHEGSSPPRDPSNPQVKSSYLHLIALYRLLINASFDRSILREYWFWILLAQLFSQASMFTLCCENQILAAS